MNNNHILSKFREGPLNFDPTYKYDDHSDNYDTSQKKRVPAWCDRILYEKVPGSSSSATGRSVELLDYNRKECYFSDHRPVLGYFYVRTCEINKEKRTTLEKLELEKLFGKEVKKQAKDAFTVISKTQNIDKKVEVIDEGY